jgi:hypothetical protein
MTDQGNSEKAAPRAGRKLERTVVQVSDTVSQEGTEPLLVLSLVEAEVAMSEEWLPQVHRECLGQDHKGLRALLLTGS